MAVRLSLKLGVVTEHDRLARLAGHGRRRRADDRLRRALEGQPLPARHVARSSTRHAREATRLAAETIRDEYYYDESAGHPGLPRRRRSRLANKRLAHQRDRARPAQRRAATARSASASRSSAAARCTSRPSAPRRRTSSASARLSTLPDPHRDRGLPTGELEPDVWRGEISVGDSLVLVSPERRRAPRPRRAQGRDGDAPPAVRDGAPAPPFRRRRGQRQRRRDRVRGDRGERHGPPADARPGQGLRSRSPARPDRSPIPLADDVQAAGVGRR